MTTVDGVTRFDPKGPGPTGLAEWETMDPATLASGEPVQRGHLYDEDASVGYLAGVWDCTAFTAQREPYSVDEYMMLLEGTVIMVMPDGTEVTVNAGEAFVIPKGLDCQWKMPGYVRKIFMILDEPNRDDAAHNPSLRRVTLPMMKSAIPAGPDAPAHAERTEFVNATGRMTVTSRISSGGRFATPPSPSRRLVTVVAGGVQLENGPQKAAFGPGETFYVTRGAAPTWVIEPMTQLVEAAYQPA